MAAFLRHIRSVPKINPFSNVHRQFNLTDGKRFQSSSISARYRHLLKTRPFLLQAVQAGVLMGAGDFIAQAYIEGTPVKDVNYMRTVRFFALGLVFVVRFIGLDLLKYHNIYKIVLFLGSNRSRLVRPARQTVDQQKPHRTNSAKGVFGPICVRADFHGPTGIDHQLYATSKSCQGPRKTAPGVL